MQGVGQIAGDMHIYHPCGGTEHARNQQRREAAPKRIVQEPPVAPNVHTAPGRPLSAVLMSNLEILHVFSLDLRPCVMGSHMLEAGS